MHSFLNLVGTIKLVKRRRMHNNTSVDVEISKHIEVHKPAFGWDIKNLVCIM